MRLDLVSTVRLVHSWNSWGQPRELIRKPIRYFGILTVAGLTSHACTSIPYQTPAEPSIGRPQRAWVIEEPSTVISPDACRSGHSSDRCCKQRGVTKIGFAGMLMQIQPSRVLQPAELVSEKQHDSSSTTGSRKACALPVAQGAS